MIAEASILSPGPWNSSDLVFSQDMGSTEFYRYHTDVDVDVGLNITSYEEVSSYHSVGGSSQSPSVASSECGEDDIAVDVGSVEHNLFHWNDSDYLQTSLPNILDDNLSDEMALTTELDWPMTDAFTLPSISDSGSDIIPSTPSSPQPVRKRSKPLDPFTIKVWSKLKRDEQTQVVETLCQIISVELGPREQMDVIRVIDPAAVISNDDTKFEINVEILTDSKWQAMREYVKRARKNNNCRLHATTERAPSLNRKSNNNSSSNTNAETKSRMNHNYGSGHHQSSNATSSGHNLINTNKVKPKKEKEQKDKEQKPPKAKALKQRQKKEYRQLLKERRSGLFVREEILSLSTLPPPEEDDEDDDIDILE